MERQPLHREMIGLASDRKINLLAYGDNGVGKTTFAATAQHHPRMRNVLFANIEGGLLSVEDMAGLPPGIRKVDIKTPADIEELYWGLRNRKTSGDNFYESVETTVIDSGTELQTKGLEFRVGEALEKEAGKKEAERRHADLDDIHQDDYGRNARATARVFRAFRDLDVNVIITAYPRFRYPPRPKGVRDWDPMPQECSPDFAPALQRHVKAYMDFVWYMYLQKIDDLNNPLEPVAGEYKRMILTKPAGIYYAKTRGRLADKMGQVIPWEGVHQPILAQVYSALVGEEAPKPTPRKVRGA